MSQCPQQCDDGRLTMDKAHEALMDIKWFLSTAHRLDLTEDQMVDWLLYRIERYELTATPPTIIKEN